MILKSIAEIEQEEAQFRKGAPKKEQPKYRKKDSLKLSDWGF